MLCFTLAKITSKMLIMTLIQLMLEYIHGLDVAVSLSWLPISRMKVPACLLSGRCWPIARRVVRRHGQSAARLALLSRLMVESPPHRDNVTNTVTP